jgi:amino acid adenylation domain-containing protein
VSDFCIHDFFDEQVARTPAATALICGQERVTYAELNERANRLAHYLRKQGVGPEVLVGIFVDRGRDMLVGILGILKAGGAYVPLDPIYPKERLSAILEDAQAPIVLTQEKLSNLLPQHAGRLIRLDADWPDIACQPNENPVRNVSPRNLAYVLFTSGSTGRPKGVSLEHRSAAIFIEWARDVFLPEELSGTLFSTSICFDLSIFEIFVPLNVGGKVIVAQNALALPKLPAASEVSLINTVPSAIAELVRMTGIPASVQVVNLAGETLPNALAQQIYDMTSVKKVYNLYGPTEDTTYSTYTLVPRGGEVTIGRPLPGTQVYILDESRKPVPTGVPGELYLAGDGLARGYFGRDDLTKERFVDNPFAKQLGARMYRTGDLARFLEDGNIQYLGRIDNQVKLRGFRIELGEIEAVLAKHPSVQSAVVVAREDRPGDKHLVAYLVPSGTSVSIALLKDLVTQHLPEYMVPSAFVELKSLPLTPNGKLDRRQLPPPNWSSEGVREVLQPRNELESKLLEIWRDTLGVPNIGMHDNFLDLGGHSLTAVRMLTEVEKVIGRELSLSILLRAPTVESLARLILEHQNLEDHDGGDPVAMEIQPGDKRRLPFFAVVPPGEESLGYAMLARQMGPGQAVYKIQGYAPIVGSARPYTRQEMQQLTDEYIAAVRTVQPHGPYCLGGLCDGTHIAEQIVLGLEAEGEEVGLFAIFDTWVLQHSQRRWLWKVDYYRRRLQQMKGMKLSERLAAYKRVAEGKVGLPRRKETPRTDWQEAYWPEGFTAARFQAPVILFKRPKQPFYYIKDPLMGWGARSEAGVEVCEVDFDHQEILREPHIRKFAKKLAERLARVNQRAVTLDAPGVPMQRVQQDS